MGFFSSLFGRKKSKFRAEELDINVRCGTIIVNDKALALPCLIDSFKEFLGKPRKFDNHSANVIFTWDEFGIYCYTKRGSRVVFCLGVKTKPNAEMPLDYDPESMFKGRLTVNGENWEQVVFSGEDEEVGRSKSIDNLGFFAEYADIEKGDRDGFEGAYSGVEIQI